MECQRAIAHQYCKLFYCMILLQIHASISHCNGYMYYFSQMTNDKSEDEKVRDLNELNIWDLTALTCGVQTTEVAECGLSFIHISCDKENVSNSASGSRL